MEASEYKDIEKSNTKRLFYAKYLHNNKRYIVARTSIVNSDFPAQMNELKYEGHPLLGKSVFEEAGSEWKAVEIKGIEPILDTSRISNVMDMDTYVGGKGLPTGDGEQSFTNLLSNATNYLAAPNAGDGWFTFKVTYEDISTHTVETVVMTKNCEVVGSMVSVSETWKCRDKEKTKNIDYSVKFYMSDVFEYDADEHASIQASLYSKENEPLVNSMRELFATELRDYIISNYRIMLATRIMGNTDIIKEEETVEIDGLVWYNGFYNKKGGTKKRGYLFYDNIPYGWRLPTMDELKSMLERHPMLRKVLRKCKENEETAACRNDAGLECRYSSYYYQFKSSYSTTNVRNGICIVTRDSNMYDDENCYFPSEIKAYSLLKDDECTLSPVEYEYNSGLKPYFIMLVKMNSDELKRQDDWCTDVFESCERYKTIDDIYADFGVCDIDSVASVEFDIDIDGEKKTYNRRRNSKHLSDMLKSVSLYTGNQSVMDAANLVISYTVNGKAWTVVYSKDDECDIRELLVMLTPLLNKDLCEYNINTYRNMVADGTHDSSINSIAERYKRYGFIPIDMYFYIKDTLGSLGINHETLKEETVHGIYSDYIRNGAQTAYITRLKMIMEDGSEVTVESIPMRYFNSSRLYKTVVGRRESLKECIDAIASIRNVRDD